MKKTNYTKLALVLSILTMTAAPAFAAGLKKSCCLSPKVVRALVAKRKLRKKFLSKKAKSFKNRKQNKKAIKPYRAKKVRMHSTKSKAKGFFKNLFTGFLGSMF